MSASRNWTWEETLVAFRLYCRTPFGKLHQHNPEIIALADKLGRTPSAVSMKGCNFASLDPTQYARGIKGLPNRSHFEEYIWKRFHTDSEAIAAEAEEAYERLGSDAEQPSDSALVVPEGPSEATRTVRVRLVQGFFRAAVLVSYDNKCALTGLAVPSLLNASHIVPWSVSPERRADPSNGLCLNVLHDRAFDRGLFTLDENLRVLVSPVLSSRDELGELADALLDFAGLPLRLPDRFSPDPSALSYRREHVYRTV